jgi:hypothetical protein
MKKTKIIYWVVTGLFSLFIISTAIPNIIKDAASIDLISKQLGFPEYMIPFLGVAKLLGAIVLLVPGFPRLKEWAYAGIFFDLAGATWAAIALWGFQPIAIASFTVFIGAEMASYFLYHKVQSQSAKSSASAVEPVAVNV